MPNPKLKIYQTSNDSGSELPSADFLLENVAKIERKDSILIYLFINYFFLKGETLFRTALSRDAQKETSSRFVANIVQAANRKIRKTAQRRSTSSSLTPDSLSLESMTTVSVF